jgi:hypothetical protein
MQGEGEGEGGEGGESEGVKEEERKDDRVVGEWWREDGRRG